MSYVCGVELIVDRAVENFGERNAHSPILKRRNMKFGKYKDFDIEVNKEGFFCSQHFSVKTLAGLYKLLDTYEMANKPGCYVYLDNKEFSAERVFIEPICAVNGTHVRVQDASGKHLTVEKDSLYLDTEANRDIFDEMASLYARYEKIALMLEKYFV